MKRRELAVLTMFILGFVSVSSLNINISRSLPAKIIVPDQYPTIQAAINQASSGDTILVKAGTYYEHIVVNKTVSLVGEYATTTIIDGNGTGHIIHVIRSHVNITEFTVENGGKRGLPALDAGICLDNVTHCAISRNKVVNAGFLGISLLYSQQNTIEYNNVTGSGWNGIHLWGSSRNAISGNILYNNTDVGINCHSSSYYNNITGNVISKVTHGIYWYDANYNALYHNNISMNQIGVYIENSTQNKIYGNNLVNNKKQAEIVGGTANTWDDGYPSGGNYWNDYAGADADRDGLGDTPYVIDGNNIDNYPLYPLWSPADVNHDLKVGILDVVRITAVYGMTSSSPNWDPYADIAQPYGKIDILDVVVCTSHYAEKYLG